MFNKLRNDIILKEGLDLEPRDIRFIIVDFQIDVYRMTVFNEDVSSNLYLDRSSVLSNNRSSVTSFDFSYIEEKHNLIKRMFNKHVNADFIEGSEEFLTGHLHLTLREDSVLAELSLNYKLWNCITWKKNLKFERC